MSLSSPLDNGLFHERTPFPQLPAPDQNTDRRQTQRQRQESQQRTRPPKAQVGVHALRGHGQEGREEVFSQHDRGHRTSCVLGVRVDHVVCDGQDDDVDAVAHHRQPDRRTYPRHVRERGPSIDEHATRDTDETAHDTHVQPCLGDRRPRDLAVSLDRGEIEPRGYQHAGPADEFADDDGGLDVAGLRGGHAVQGGKDLLDGLCEQVDGADHEGRPEREDEEHGFREEHP